MDFMFDWEAEGDRFSFEDSDRFEEDSLCSWISEPESLCNNWRGWRRQNGGQPGQPVYHKKEDGTGGVVTSLVELGSQAVACHLPFEVVETFYPHIPEQLQLRIAFWSFPENEEDIRLYSCLANGSADEFLKGDHLYKARAVKDVLQIGFHLSATVVPPQTLVQAKGSFNVAVVFDRRRITSCNCTCSASASWCAHVVALCLYRIHQATSVCLRAPVSESLSRLHRDQLQKFAQYLISELPQQILPTAQRLLDELLSSQQTAMNTVCGAPDPTAGPSASEQTTWCLDESTLHENIKKTLIKFCVPSPIVFSDVNYLSSTAPPAAAEWQSLLRPLRGREPEGMWNLLSIVREMYKRHDSNAIPLLEILTEEVLACEQILLWWFNTKISASHTSANMSASLRNSQNCNSSSASTSQHAASSLCDEIVTLWRLAALNPALSPIQRDDLSTQLKDWHMLSIDKVRKARGTTVSAAANGAGGGAGGNPVIKKCDIEIFPGFKPALEACQLDWTDYVILGVTYVERHPPQWRFSFGRAGGDPSGRRAGRSHHTSQVSGVGMKPVDGPLAHHHHHHSHGGLTAYIKSQLVVHGGGIVTTTSPGRQPMMMAAAAAADHHGDAAYSSSSEGFCESDRRESNTNQPGGGGGDSDSDLGAEMDGVRPKTSSASGGLAVGPDDVFSAAGEAGTRKLIPAAKISKAATEEDELDYQSSMVAAMQVPVPFHPTVSSQPRPGLNAASIAEAIATVNQQQPYPVGGASLAPPASSAAAAAAAAAPGVQPAPMLPIPVAESESDEYQVYYYDPKGGKSDDKSKKGTKDEPNYFAGIKKTDNKQDILFARAEALHAHGHTREACRLAKQLAEEMLNNPPDLTHDQPPPPPLTTCKGKKKKSSSVVAAAAAAAVACNPSSFASTTLTKAAFLCNVLLEEPECHHLAFRVGLFGLEMPRPPASSKALDVKLAYQECELVTLLKRIPLGGAELAVVKDRAERLRDGKLKLRGEALLPLTLASFIFDSLCLPIMPGSQYLPPIPAKPGGRTNIKAPPDEKLGFDACVEALGLKANVSEAEYPLLCEGTRRQRGDLALAMMVHYKDDQLKLSKIMDKVLDKEVHQLYKAPSLSNYLSRQAVGSSPQAAASASAAAQPFHPHNSVSPGLGLSHSHSGVDLAAGGGALHCDSEESLRDLDAPRSNNSSDSRLVAALNSELQSLPGPSHWEPVSAAAEATTSPRPSGSLDYLNLERKFSDLHMGEPPVAAAASPKTDGGADFNNSKEAVDSALEDDMEGTAEDYKAWEAKFRCLNLKKLNKHSNGMASIDSSAPETTSSDNSPTLVRRSWAAAKHHQGPGSDSGSSGKSSDSGGSTSSAGDKLAAAAAAAKAREDQDRCESPPMRYGPQLSTLYSRSSTPSMKNLRYKGKNRLMPTVPNQPSEASAHFMFELAKNVLTKAGGNSSTSLFTQPATNNNPINNPHRNLHLCAFQIGLYALGLHNCVSPNWLSRTYSSHVSWITGQAMEIGSAAINILIDTWEGHLTPQEVASLADRASRGRDPNMVKAAAELALSCLPHAQALNPNEIQRALIQCKEQSQEMLERACLAVESAAKGGGVYPEVLFDVAKRWYELYEEALQGPGGPPHTTVGGGPVLLNHIVVTSSASVMDDGGLGGGDQQLAAAIQVVGPHPGGESGSMSSPPAAAAAAMLQLVSASHQPGPPGPPGTVAVQQLQPYNLQPHLQPAPHPGASAQMAVSHPYIHTPYSYVQQMPPNLAHHYSTPPLALHTHNIHPSYVAATTYPTPVTGAGGYPAPPTQPGAISVSQQQQAPFPLNNAHAAAAALYHANISHLRGPPPTVQVYAAAGQQMVPRTVMHNKFGQLVATDQQQQPAAAAAAIVVQQIPVPQHTQLQQQQHQQHQQQHMQSLSSQHHEVYPPPGVVAANSPAMTYLLATYRVGMLAMETLARRVHDDRPQTKYARNPPLGEDVKWLLTIAMKLMSYTGTNYLQQFCGSAVNSVVSPFVLQDIAVDCAHFLARGNPTHVSQQFRTPTLNTIVQKCIQMFVQCTHHRMHHINQSDYEEFVSTVCSARNAFCMTPGGMVQFNELLQSLRRSKSCKKELWQRIVSGLQTGNI